MSPSTMKGTQPVSTKNRRNPLLLFCIFFYAKEKLNTQTDPDNNNIKSGGANKTVHAEEGEREREREL